MHDHHGSMSHTYLHFHKNIHIQTNNKSFVKCEVTNRSITSFCTSGDPYYIILLWSLCTSNSSFLVPFCMFHLPQKIIIFHSCQFICTKQGSIHGTYSMVLKICHTMTHKITYKFISNTPPQICACQQTCSSTRCCRSLSGCTVKAGTKIALQPL